MPGFEFDGDAPGLGGAFGLLSGDPPDSAGPDAEGFDGFYLFDGNPPGFEGAFAYLNQQDAAESAGNYGWIGLGPFAPKIRARAYAKAIARPPVVGALVARAAAVAAAEQQPPATVSRASVRCLAPTPLGMLLRRETTQRFEVRFCSHCGAPVERALH